MTDTIVTIIVGDRFTFNDPKAPDWTHGVWEVLEVRDQSIRCRAEGGRIAWLETSGTKH